MIIFRIIEAIAEAVAIWGSRSHAADPFRDGMARPW